MHIVAAGLPNLGKVSEQLYRGAQPGKEGYAELKNMGVGLVVSLREHTGNIEEERRLVEAQGLRFVSLTMAVWSRPSNAQVAQFLGLLRANPETKVFVHCQRGAERTGVMVAAYRISSEQWTPEQAIAEMKEFHFRSFFFPHFKGYVRDFPRSLQTDPDLRKLLAGSK